MSTPAWVASFGEAHAERGNESFRACSRAAPPRTTARRSYRELRLHSSPAEWSPTESQSEGCHVIFDGILYNRAEIRAQLPTRLPADASDADIVRLAYLQWGAETLLRLSGVFALIVWDSAQDRLVCTRDRAGLHPLFCAEALRTLLLSPSIESLLDQPHVSRDINRPGLVDHLAMRWLKSHETFFSSVRRVPPCHVLRVEGGERSVHRYWDPVPPRTASGWVPDDEAQDRFDEGLKQAVARCLTIGPAAINLSGGIDSSSVAALATDLCRRDNHPPPWALSLVFPGLHVDDETAQQGVAAALGLQHLQLPFDEATGPKGALEATLDLSRTMPSPVSSVLRPALTRMVVEGSQRGCRAILTGDGADEWVAGNPNLAGDLLRSLDLNGMYRLWRTLKRSYPVMVETPLHSMVWRWGAIPLLRDALYTSRAGKLVRTLAHSTIVGVRRRRIADRKPSWITPEPGLDAEVGRREMESWDASYVRSNIESLSLRASRMTLDLPQKWLFHEENFELARRAGVRVAQPFWDADLIDLMMTIRPEVRIRDGVTKSLLRGSLTRRFPGLGFQRRLKSYTGSVILSALSKDTAEARRAMGDTWALGELGVVDPVRIPALLDRALAGGNDGRWERAWDLINLEMWTRAHYSK